MLALQTQIIQQKFKELQFNSNFSALPFSPQRETTVVKRVLPTVAYGTEHNDY